MSNYQAPLRDLKFLLREVFHFDEHYAELSTSHFANLELVETIVAEAAKFGENELAPINQSGDAEGCRLENGEVSTPSGFKEAYRLYVEGGWAGISGDPSFGGQGLPHSVGVFVEEVMASANMAWSLYPGLSRAAITMLTAHGTDQQKSEYLTKLLTGKWTGTMCLTESHCGSDVGLLRTSAEPNPDGSYRITGTKIFISAGEHDLAENIVHLVLARLPQAPAGTKGISLFLVPKWIGQNRNAVMCGAIEEKMGIHGASTCVMHFENATGFLIGPQNDGMRCMFTMMNGARLIVGVQALSEMEMGYQASLSYAKERLQMRALSGPTVPEMEADPIIVHPDVRRMLMTQKALVEGSRALTYMAAKLVDTSNFGPPDERDRAGQLLDFLTPIVKGFITEVGFEAVNHAVQIFGGHGYIRESGIEQLVRDARITMIYEGTTQIQALDLLGRKVLMNQGVALMDFLELVNDEAAASDYPELGEIATRWAEVSSELGRLAVVDANEVGAASFDYLMFSGYATLAYLWSKMARAAGTDDFGKGKRAAADFFFSRLLPRAESHRLALLAGADSLMKIEAGHFSHH